MKTQFQQFQVIRLKLCENWVFPQNSHTRKLGDISVFYAVVYSIRNTRQELNFLFCLTFSDYFADEYGNDYCTDCNGDACGKAKIQCGECVGGNTGKEVISDSKISIDFFYKERFKYLKMWQKNYWNNCFHCD